MPRVSVTTVRLELVDEAKKLSKLETEVVATTPLRVEVITPALAEIAFEVMIEEVAVTPFTVVVSVFPVAEVVSEFMKSITADETPFTNEVKLLVEVDIVFAKIMSELVVAITPFTTDVQMYEFVEVETVSRLVVLDASRSEADIFWISPFAPSTRSDEVAVPVARLVIDRLVVVELPATTFARLAVPVAVILVPVALSNKRFEM